MTRFVPDTNGMIAAVYTWHEHHERAANEIDRRLERGETLWVAAPTLVEVYAVLTRLPPPYRLSPADALVLIEENFIQSARIVTLASRSYRRFLRRVRDEGIHGGRTYDAVIASCAHFLPFEEHGIAIVVPGEAN